MKKLFAIIAFVFVGTVSFAQWVYVAPNTYFTGGNVGIGTTTPSFLLHVVAPSAAAQFVLNSDMTIPGGTGTTNLGQYDMRYKNGTTGTGVFYRNVLRYNGANSNYEMQQTLKNLAGGFLNFMYVNLNTGVYQVQSGVTTAEFKNSGNVLFNNTGAIGVGLGTMAIPSGAKVAVGGKVVCKEIEVTLAGLPDFVFNKDYKLMSLYDVENFINSNKHLPGVPSEKEVLENGLNLGDMNATLLQKVEELTLYMIQLQKDNDALKARISSLEK